MFRSLVGAALEAIFQRKLDDSRIHRSRRDLAKCGGAREGDGRISKLRVIEDVEEFGAELDVLPLCDSRILNQRKVEVDVAGTEQNTLPRIAIPRAISDNRGRGESEAVKVAGTPAGPTEPRLDAARRNRGRECCAGSELSRFDHVLAAGQSVDRARSGISDGQRSAVLDNGDAG